LAIANGGASLHRIINPVYNAAGLIAAVAGAVIPPSLMASMVALGERLIPQLEMIASTLLSALVRALLIMVGTLGYGVEIILRIAHASGNQGVDGGVVRHPAATGFDPAIISGVTSLGYFRARVDGYRPGFWRWFWCS